MQIVINVPEKLICEGFERHFTEEEKNILIRAIGNGTPLPKGHGRLIILSEDAIKREQTSFSFSCQSWISDVGLSNATVAITEANEGNIE